MRWRYFRPYVSVDQRRRQAAQFAAKLAKSGRRCSPVTITGQTIARTFWGKAWCDNLEAYSDFSNRLPRGRTYVRNGSVIDLQVAPGRISALVSGSEIYDIDIKIKPVPPAKCDAIRAQCAGQVGSLVELLQGRLSKEVMAVITRPGDGLFPAPEEIAMKCSCPDWAGLCKHLAAVLYGIGARLDDQPELLFTLRKVDHLQLIQAAAVVDRLVKGAAPAGHTVAEDQLGEVFGIELDGNPDAAAPLPTKLQAGKPKPVSTARGPRAAASPVADSAASPVELACPSGATGAASVADPPAATSALQRAIERLRIERARCVAAVARIDARCARHGIRLDGAPVTVKKTRATRKTGPTGQAGSGQ